MPHKDPVVRKAYELDYYRKNKKQMIKKTQKRRREIKYKVLNHYCGNNKLGPWCQCCGETIIEFLTIDHIDGKGAEHRRKLNRHCIYTWLIKNNYPKGFQVLCLNCNFARWAYGKCPHKYDKERK